MPHEGGDVQSTTRDFFVKRLGVDFWIGQFDGLLRAFFLPYGVMHLRDIPSSETIDNPPSGRVSLFVKNGVLSLLSSAGANVVSGAPVRYAYNGTVPSGGVRYLQGLSGIFCSTVGDRVFKTAVLTGITLQLDVIDGSRAYDLEVLTSPSGTPVVVATLAIPVSTKTISSSALSVSIPAGTEIGMRLTRTSGSGASTFTQVVANLFLNT